MDLATAELFPSHLMLSTRLTTELGAARSTLRATTERSGSAVAVHAGGEIDACNEGTWRRLLDEAATAAVPPGPFVIDTSGVEFMGCCAFAALADVAYRCRRRGVDLRLVSRQPIVARVVRTCGLSDLLPVHPTMDSALSAATGLPQG
ncbi:anti-sigma factor antagonist [Mycobacterium sp. SM1]|uniref:anti-sigma factor antagonist n=1 Tax=Mycobacterium sp. SM1 TaxID=2816243 RepID=UPI001BCFDAAE|nr:anti-sigma factor antagonist [Mycobacterium sp. SM1]MBS4727123.1 anti-sigma factor antagonist [Mycobacterium sp. SM1]